MNDSHIKAAEFHQRAAHAHNVAAADHEKGDHLSGRELSRQALEHSAKAFELAQEAHRESEKRARESA